MRHCLSLMRLEQVPLVPQNAAPPVVWEQKPGLLVPHVAPAAQKLAVARM